MLYDPKWEDKLKEPSLAGLAAWLETQDPATVYNWLSTKDCLMCRYARSIGMTIHGAGGSYWRMPDQSKVEWPKGSTNVARHEPFTYGAALQRARNMRDESR